MPSKILEEFNEATKGLDAESAEAKAKQREALKKRLADRKKGAGDNALEVSPTHYGDAYSSMALSW